ncbi:hypothetical protein [Fictibacillus sp. S7]|nr:hypothetical protein [Fictibacillus sp. S7]
MSLTEKLNLFVASLGLIVVKVRDSYGRCVPGETSEALAPVK